MMSLMLPRVTSPDVAPCNFFVFFSPLCDSFTPSLVLVFLDDGIRIRKENMIIGKWINILIQDFEKRKCGLDVVKSFEWVVLQRWLRSRIHTHRDGGFGFVGICVWREGIVMMVVMSLTSIFC